MGHGVDETGNQRCVYVCVPVTESGRAKQNAEFDGVQLKKMSSLVLRNVARYVQCLIIRA